MNQDPLNPTGKDEKDSSQSSQDSLTITSPIPPVNNISITDPEATAPASTSPPVQIDARKSKIVFHAKYRNSISAIQSHPNRPTSHSSPPLPTAMATKATASGMNTLSRVASPGSSSNALEITPFPKGNDDNSVRQAAAASSATPSLTSPPLPAVTAAVSLPPTKSLSVRRNSLMTSSNLYSSNNRIDTKLLIAASSGKLQLMQTSIEEGANIKATDSNGENIVLLAARHGHKEVLIWLHDVKQMSLEERNKNGYTPLMLATANGRLEVMKWLLEKRVDLHAINKRKETAYDIANIFKHTTVINLLLPYYEPSEPLTTQEKLNNSPATSVFPSSTTSTSHPASPPPEQHAPQGYSIAQYETLCLGRIDRRKGMIVSPPSVTTSNPPASSTTVATATSSNENDTSNERRPSF